MDLGIRGRRAIVCGGSAGLGRGTATALAADGVDVLIAARDPERLTTTAQEIEAQTGTPVRTISADVTTEAGRKAVLEACPQPDILINNAGGPPPGDFRDWDREAWIKALDNNMLSAIFLIQAVIDGMIARRFGRIVNITSHMVKQPVAILGLSNGARAGLTGFCGGLARDVAQHGVTINSVLPGQFDTDRLRSNHQKMAGARGVPLEKFQDAQRAQIPARRFGTAEEFGAACAFLCSVQAGYITGQNLLLDGGQFPGLL
ncbi:SDR family oxidoreductase [Zavarzinia sp. CC-PAN008]|uniref:SDR family oxidoreductase n=1 Tax=Zavarzinia sp. CC-PAN008 TaxID=3243332 RepID=UPI003F743C94